MLALSGPVRTPTAGEEPVRGTYRPCSGLWMFPLGELRARVGLGAEGRHELVYHLKRLTLTRIQEMDTRR